jgi:membrane protease YdiL (CAAX protease family)
MLERKPLTWFLVLTFLISWPLFLIPLLFTELDAVSKQLLTQGLWACAMWGPGIAAIISTLFVEKVPFKNLRLNTLGPKKYYLWAWLLPLALSLLGGVFTVLFGIAEPDLGFTSMREMIASTPGLENVSLAVIIGIQVALAVTLAPFFNTLFALGEELGWRGYLLPKLLPLGQWKAITISGFIWGFWHAPAVVQGLNYPGYPVPGVFMMIIFCVLTSIIVSWLYLNTKSPWVAALAHGSLNAVAALPVLFLQPGFDIAFGGTLATPMGWLALILFIAWLVWTKRFPVQSVPIETGTGGPVLSEIETSERETKS